MKKLSEVCKIVGVTRRALQVYDEIGLLRPTEKNEAGYWFYDEAEIKKLILIKIFIEAGYKLKRIKSIFDSRTLDLFEEFDFVISTLEEKRKNIDGMIDTLKLMKLASKLSENTLQAMEKLDVTHIFKEKSFKSYLEDTIHDFGESDEEYNPEDETYILFFWNLIAVGSFLDIPEDSNRVQLAVAESYKNILEIVNSVKDETDEEPTEDELTDFFLEITKHVLNEPDIKNSVDIQCGNGAIEYILRAVELFCTKRRLTLMT